MSIFGNIMNTIVGHHGSGAATGQQASPAPSAPAGQQATAGTAVTRASGGAGVTTSTAASTPAQPAALRQEVDVEAVLTQMQTNRSEQLNWRTSIVDLLKLLGLDSSLTARKELASELQYTGSTDDSAAMNIWLHKQVMQKLAENGANVPDDLKH